MGTLIRLEWKKNGLRRYLFSALLLTALLALFLFAQCYLGIANDPVTGVPDAAPGTFNITSQVELVTNVSFMLFTCAMIAGCITGSRPRKAQSLLFTYPVRRQKLLAAQLLAVWLFCFAAAALAKTFLYALLFCAGQSMTPDFPLNYTMLAPAIYLQILLKSVVTVTVSLIALPIGRFFHSSAATILAAIGLLLVMNGTVGEFSLANNAVVPVLLTAAGILCAALTLFGVEHRDVAV